MNKLTLSFLALFLILVIVLPTFIVRGCDFRSSPLFSWKKENTSFGTPLKTSEKRIAPGKVKKRMIKVYRTDLQKTVVMELEEYIKGVVAAEMPVKFQIEALKAQAVAARTFALKRASSGKASLSTDFNVAQDWISSEKLKEKWGEENYLAYSQKISQAVEETRGLVLIYKGKLINAYYHSTCGGKTEAGEEIFQHALPYLQPVSCQYDQHSLRYRGEKSFSLVEVKKILGVKEKKQLNLQIIAHTKGGRIKKLRAGGKIFEGAEVRKLLGLRSTRFSWQLEGDKINFLTIGNGHGVGMCQYGADGLAKQGKNFVQILQYYYSGVKITDYSKLE